MARRTLSTREAPPLKVLRHTGLFPQGQLTTELFDVYHAPTRLPSGSFAPPRLAGFTKERSKVHADGDWHRSVHLWLADTHGNVLMQQRSKHKDTHPGLWDVSCAGHVEAGDDPRETAARELKEELGVEVHGGADSLVHICTVPTQATGCTQKHGKFWDNEFQDIFAFILPGDQRLFDIEYRVSEGEVAGLRVESATALEAKLREGCAEYVPRDAEGYLDQVFPALSGLSRT
jgi:isopentenyldiphosphate isomerase